MLLKDEMIVKGLAARDSRAIVSGLGSVGAAASTVDGWLLYDRCC
jgi:hypothetical protein